MKDVAIIGFGIMGQALGRKFLDAGLSLRAFDLNSKAIAAASSMGIPTFGSPMEAAAGVELIILLLPNPAAVSECMTAENGLLAAPSPGTVIVDMSTVAPEGTRRMAALAEKAGLAFLDAPVLGRPSGVGRWALPVGGDAGALERCRAVLEIAAANVIHVGASGSGNVIKLLNQMMFNAINAMTAEMMAVAEHMGVSRKLLYETIVISKAGTVSNLFVELGRNVADENYDNPTFSVNLLCKDLELAVAMAETAGAAPPLALLIKSFNTKAREQGFGDKDTSVMWKVMKPLLEPSQE